MGSILWTIAGRASGVRGQSIHWRPTFGLTELTSSIDHRHRDAAKYRSCISRRRSLIAEAEKRSGS